jgi:hypothetical protein
MSNSDTKQAPKGPSVTAKGVMPKSHLSRWGSSNLSFPAERGRKGKETKVATQDWKMLILLQRKMSTYRRLPANLRGALTDFMTPLGRDNQGWASRRDKTGGETGEIVTGGVAS